MPLTKQEHDSFLQTVHQIRDVFDQLKSDVDKYGNETGELKEQAGRLEQKIQLLEAEKHKPIVSSKENKEEENTRLKQAFLNAMRYGYERLPEEQKSLVPRATTVEAPPVADMKAYPAGALVAAEDTAGGLFAPPEFVSDIIKGYIQFSPVRSVARVRTTSNRSIQQPKRTGTFTAQWVGEKVERANLTGYTLGRIEIPTQEMYALALVSEQDLEDVSFDLEGQLRDEFSEQFGVAEGKAFISGNATLQPQGILTHPDLAALSGASQETAPSTDMLMKVMYDLPDIYAQNAMWGMRRSTVGAIRALRYGTTDQRYIWDPGITAQTPSTILGRPYLELQDMPAVAAGAKSILFGDFNRSYLIVDRAQMTFKRLAERWVEDALIGIYARKRVGGQLVLPEAMRLYTLHA